MAKEPVFIGMDLGTFKTSVASSTGKREVLNSAVGWPRDHIARTLLGRDVIFGRDLIEQRLALDVLRPFEKGVLKYAESSTASAAEIDKRKHAARLLVEHAVSLVRPAEDCQVYGVIGAPSRASVANKKVILEAARTSFDAVMIVSEPFSIAYGMNRLTDALVVDIGAGTIDLCPIYGILPQEEDQVTIGLGGDVIDEQFHAQIREAFPEAQLSWNMAREIKEKYGFVNEVDEKVMVHLPVRGVPREFDVTGPLKAACQTIVGPILEGLRDLVGRFDPEFQSRLRNNIILGGGGSQLRGLDRVIEQGLRDCGGARVTRVGDAVFAGAGGALKLAMATPPSFWNQLRFARVEPEALAA